MHLKIKTPRWAIPHLTPARYKGAKGGRSSGKSHFFAEYIVEQHVCNPDRSTVCIRETQRSLKYSAKRLIEKKIRDLGVTRHFKITHNEIKNVRGSGVIIFQGMQDHTADSIKSLEGFDCAWLEEAQRISQRSLDLLLPTIRNPGSEILASWNPDQPTDPIDVLFADDSDDFVLTHCNYLDNPFCPETSIKEAMRWMKSDPDGFGHVWLGLHNTKSDDQILAGKWVIDDVEPPPFAGKHTSKWDGPYYGVDWGFSTDPTTLIECYIKDNNLYITRELFETGVEIEDLPKFFNKMGITPKQHTVRADNARPELISYCKRHWNKKLTAVEKWPGSIQDGITKLRSFDKIIINSACVNTIEEAKLYKYKRDRLTGDVLTDIIDKHNHCIDAIRYAIAPLIKTVKKAKAW